MALSDPIADYLTRIRNAQMAGHRMVTIPSSKMKKSITEILYKQGYIFKYMFDTNEKGFEQINIALKYDRLTKKPVIRKMGRISTPGLRRYASKDEIPRIINGLGVCIVSTSKGVMTDKQAKKENVGGELICYIY